MQNRKALLEKALKSFLKKKKIGFTAALLISFLITGQVAANEDIEGEKETIAERIAILRKEIRTLLDENEKRLAEIREKRERLIREADWYGKPRGPLTSVSLITDWHYGKAREKNWVDTDHGLTAIDQKRRQFNEVAAGVSGTGDLVRAMDYTRSRYPGADGICGNRTTGWITGSPAWQGNTNTYDYNTKLMILPALRIPEAEVGSAPKLTFTLPAAPFAPVVAPPQPLGVAVGNIAVRTPVIKTPSVAPPPGLTPPAAAPVTAAEPNISVRPVTIGVNPATPQFSVTPQVPTVAVKVSTPETIAEPNPADPSRQVNPVTPDADPFSDFSWGWLTSGQTAANKNLNDPVRTNPLGENIDVTAGIFWSGYNPFTNQEEDSAGYKGAAEDTTYHPKSGLSGDRTFDRRHQSIINSYNGRWTKTRGNIIKGGEFHVKGMAGQGTAEGTEAFHLVGDVHLENVTANLYGKAAFINAESFRGGQTTMQNVAILVRDDQNTIFHLKGSDPGQDAGGYNGGQFSTKFAGSADINVQTRGNSVFAVRNFAGGLRLENTGSIVLDGASNIGFSFLTWVPDKSKYIASQFKDYAKGGNDGEGILEAYIPYVKLDPAKPMRLNGDENVGIFFSEKLPGRSWDVGVHQGYFELFFEIGTGAPDPVRGDLNEPGYTAGLTDGSVGVYAVSGQRIGVSRASLSNYSFYDRDPVHDLIFDRFKITFGEKSRNGFMFLVKNGTVVDIQNKIQQRFSDGAQGSATPEAQTGENTIVAYAEGTWTDTGTGLKGVPNGSPTEIKVAQDLDMVSKNGIAWFAENDGKITVTADTTAWGRNSIVAYARSGGLVEITGNIAAEDGIVAQLSDKFSNIGAFAGAGGEVSVAGNMIVNGIGAFANGLGAKIFLNGAANEIRTGTNGALDALNGGSIDFGGGTIIHRENQPGDHAGELAFFADRQSNINFTGSTTLQLYHGVAFYGDKTDYAAALGSGARYNGMGNVDVILMEHGVNLGVFRDLAIDWRDVTTGGGKTAEQHYLDQIEQVPQVRNINPNGKWYYSYLEGGTLDIGKDVDLDAYSQGTVKGGDPFNDITMERERVTIEAGITVESKTGLGLSMGSNDSANVGGKNAESGFDNRGRVNVSGGNAIGLFVSYGHILNGGDIIVDGSIAAAGANGSRLKNDGAIVVNGTGIGMAGMSRKVTAAGTPDLPEMYGTDAGDLTTDLISLHNNGSITVAGQGGVGLYADNNTGPAGSKTRVRVENSGRIAVGEKGAGIFVKGTDDGGVILLTNNGKAEIRAGKDGIGVYGENSDVILGGSQAYELVTEENGIGILLKGTGTLSPGTLRMNYQGAVSGSATALVWQGAPGENMTNDTNLEIITPSGMSGAVSGLYAEGGGTVTNNGAITGTSDGFYGIISRGTDIINTNRITTGQATGAGGIGIYAKDAAIDTYGNLILTAGDKAVGVYTENGSLSGGKILRLRQGSAPMSVQGKKALGFYAKDQGNRPQLTLLSETDMALAPSASENDRRIGLALEEMTSAGNKVTGRYILGGSATEGANTGIYAKNSALTFGGTLRLSGVKNIGIAAEASGGGAGTLTLAGADIGVVTDSLADADLNVGVYGAGNGLSINAATPATLKVSPNGAGIYLKGASTSFVSGDFSAELSSEAGGKSGIGLYFEGGAAYTSGTLTLKSGKTAVDQAGNPVRPAGLFYGKDSAGNNAKIVIAAGSGEIVGLYEKSDLRFINNGEILIEAKGIGAVFTGGESENLGHVEIKGDGAYGLYWNGGRALNSGAVEAVGADTVALIADGTGTEVTNAATVRVDKSSGIGLYSEQGAKLINGAAGVIDAGGADVAAYTRGGFLENAGSVKSSLVGVYANDGGEALQKGGVIETGAIGLFAAGKDASGKASAARLLGGSITGAGGASGLTGAFAKDGAILVLDGASIALTGPGSTGLRLERASGRLLSGSLTLGSGGVGVYALGSSLDFSGFTGSVSVGTKGVGIYAEDTSFAGNAPFRLDYAGIGGDKGVGIYYKGTTPVTNGVSVVHGAGGTNLVHLYADGVSLINTADQDILEDGIGIFTDNGSHTENRGKLTLRGNNTIGIFIDKSDPAATGTSTLSDPGTIEGDPVGPGGGKAGIYVKNGDISGNKDYHFDLDGGVGLYLATAPVSWTGLLRLRAEATATDRAIGVYAAHPLSGTLRNGISIEGAGAVGIYLATDGTKGASVDYAGALSISAPASPLGRAIGALLDTGARLTLTPGATVSIGGADNIGFYVKAGATLDVSGGSVSNTPDGVFAYLEDGALHFGASNPFTINYANVAVSGASGRITNDTTLNVGTRGLQAADHARITNNPSGLLESAVTGARGMSGADGSVLVNLGVISLSGDKSVAIYAGEGSKADSSGSVAVGAESVAYYAGKDTGAGRTEINVSGPATLGRGSVLFYGEGGDIRWTGGKITLSAETTGLVLTGAAAVVDFGGAYLSAGEKGVGLFLKNDGDYANIRNLSGIDAGKDGTAIFTENGKAVASSISIALGPGATGVLAAGTGWISYGGHMSSADAGAKGILSTGGGSVANSGKIILSGESSVGLYGKNATALSNGPAGLIDMGGGTGKASAVAMFGDGATGLVNDGTIRLAAHGAGMYARSGNVLNNGSLSGSGSDNTGLYVIGGNAENRGVIQLNDTSNGVYVENGSIVNSGDVAVGGDKASGLYGAGTTGISHLGGTVAVGARSVGVASEAGDILVDAGAKLTAGEESTYLYTKNGTVVLRTDLALSDYSVGMAARDGTAVNYAKITVGASRIGQGAEKISAAMATGSADAAGNPVGGGTLINHGTVDVPRDYGVAMLANNGTGRAENRGLITVSGKDAYGMEGSNRAVLSNSGTIVVNGEGARGMAGTGGALVINEAGGLITVSGQGAEGIYAAKGGIVRNYGVIEIDGGAAAGISLGQGGVLENAGTIHVRNAGLSVANNNTGSARVGSIVISDQGPEIRVGNVVYDAPTLLNGGYMDFGPGVLDFGTLKIGGTDGHIGTISAGEFAAGRFIVLPNATQGNNLPVRIIQYLKGAVNMPNNGSIEAVSHSVTWLAELQADPTNPDIYRIILVKIPYADLTAGTKAEAFGHGLDAIYEPAAGTELRMFDALDLISDKEELAATFDMELRGNFYADLRERVWTVGETLGKAADKLRDNEIYARERTKIGALVSGGKKQNSNPGLVNCDWHTTGLLVLHETDGRIFGRTEEILFGFTRSVFEYDGGSRDRALTLHLGLGYGGSLGDSGGLSWRSTGMASLGRHEAKRRIHLSSGVYTNEANYWTGLLLWENSLRYALPIPGDSRFKAGISADLDLGWGRIGDIRETGDGIFLGAETDDIFSVRPGAGVDLSWTKYTKRGKWVIGGVAAYRYELGKGSDEPVRARILRGGDFYDLEAPERVRGVLETELGLRYETRGGNALLLTWSHRSGDRDGTTCGVQFTHLFD
ncbi:MAG: hypothetical protein LBQ97_09220 [Fusobacteriaceae bacterium]|jgi:hypothetical protein|nr:hypothetical protein [Fusobacteriaceae bacterium]